MTPDGVMVLLGFAATFFAGVSIGMFIIAGVYLMTPAAADRSE